MDVTGQLVEVVAYIIDWAALGYDDHTIDELVESCFGSFSRWSSHQQTRHGQVPSCGHTCIVGLGRHSPNHDHVTFIDGGSRTDGGSPARLPCCTGVAQHRWQPTTRWIRAPGISEH
jgi:hypothetical protein